MRENSPTTRDYRTDRVRIFYNKTTNKVVGVPRRGWKYDFILFINKFILESDIFYIIYMLCIFWFIMLLLLIIPPKIIFFSLINLIIMATEIEKNELKLLNSFIESDSNIFLINKNEWIDNE